MAQHPSPANLPASAGQADPTGLTLSTLPLIPVGSPEARACLEGVTHVYTDLDGTLFAPGGRLLASHAGEPSTATAEALVACKRTGIEVIIVTGRNGMQGNELLRILDLDTFIGELGCLRMDGFGAKARISYELGDWEHAVLDSGLAPGVLPEGVTPYQLIERSGVLDRLTAAFPGRLEVHRPYPGERMVTHPLRGNVDGEKVVRLLADEALPLTLLDNGQIHPQTHTLVDCPEIHIYHLMPRGASKALAVAHDIALRGLAPERTLAIGDARADMEMGEHTGSLVVLANALPSAAVQEALRARAERAERAEQQAGRGGATATEAVAETGPGRAEPAAATLYTEGSTADGWVEFAHALLTAKGAGQEGGASGRRPGPLF
ncbi:MAG: HAD hydrolase family protein [Coriobacteriales bacterium]|jgi:hydroxymethylpyrimidine pyrophosphatase-like HAD family hydrolase|nr:HAD hydrolase family protein [Coriobacteriales bacterium]